MMVYKNWFLILCLILSNQWVFSQEHELKEIFFHEMIEKSINGDPTTPLIFDQYLIKRKYKSASSLRNYLESTYGTALFNTASQVSIRQDLVIKNCQIEGHFDLQDISFERSLNIYFTTMKDLMLSGTFNSIHISNNTMQRVRIMNSVIKGDLILSENESIFINLLENTFSGHVSIINNDTKEEIKINNSEFNPTREFICSISNDTVSYGRPFYHNIQLDIKSIQPIKTFIEGNRFLSSDPYQRIKLRGLLNELTIERNYLESTLDFTDLAINSRFIMSNNEIKGYLAFNDLIFPEIFNLLRWEQLQGNKIAVMEKVRASYKSVWQDLIECDMKIMSIEDKDEVFSFPYHGYNLHELKDEAAFEKLIYSYKALHSIYTQRGDLESSNACYAEMKDIQKRRLQYIFEQQGGFKNFFRWQLNNLLKIYTNHGTDPALAMVISVYVVLIFGVVYFFFPSEWDVSTKSKLIRDFKHFIEKNESGYIKPFLILLLGFLVSLFNALTLSLNSFITLGFGNIPAKGFAKYVCVLEGFIGWFLLSIFTVALINQVLA